MIILTFRINSYVSITKKSMFVCFWRDDSPQWGRASSFMSFLDLTQRHTTVRRTPLDEWSTRRRGLYLTTHNRQTSMPLVGFEPTISAGERPQTYALDRAAIGTGEKNIALILWTFNKWISLYWLCKLYVFVFALVFSVVFENCECALWFG
jgi:hypothetical protein